MAIRLENGYDPHSMERSIGRVFITSRKTGKIGCFPTAGQDCLEVACLATVRPGGGCVHAVSMPNYSKRRRKDGNRHYSLN